jgi:serine/threonine-protein kinase
MTIIAGTKLGPYEIISAIGAGGMGEVYRARDSRLNRDVAIKVLPEEFAGNAERMARFQREAQVLASLNHPNIASIHGLEESIGVRALVMELVEGTTLAERIAHGPISFDDALPIAKQITEALEAAHEKGIVHRDLKPANVIITPDGVVKVLDFGLAKALQGESAEYSPTTSPTLTIASTQAGVIIGTAAYMSPEQARGKGVDRRADIWGFGTVLFEMLTGKQAFSGETVSDTLAAVLRSEPEWASLPTGTPAAILHLLHRCLEKDPKRRLRDIGEARVVLSEPNAAVVSGTTLQALPASTQPLWRRALPWMLAALLGISLAALALSTYLLNLA